ncbi:MAG: nucleotidyltransferase domain-containing protein [Deltaproteobacteria bacterium]|nr:nucleotidyltransferase domain-containing protein [Deltaproteobacteria bacterium]
MTETEIKVVLQKIVERITERFRPEKIILFGSYARGKQTADSDADLLIVMNVTGSKRMTAVEIDLLLVGIPIPTDIIVVTPEEVEIYQDCVGTIIREAIREGKVIYERAA